MSAVEDFDKLTQPAGSSVSRALNESRIAQTVGLGEPVVQMATGTIGMLGGPVAGAAAGGLAWLDKQITGANVDPDRMAAEARKGFQEAVTYRPRTETGKLASSIIAKIMTPVTWVAGKAGELVSDATGSQFAGGVAEDAAGILAAKGMGAAAPKALSMTANGAKIVGNRVVRPAVDRMTSVNGNLALAGIHGAAGNPLGVAGHLGVAYARSKFDKRAGAAAEPIVSTRTDLLNYGDGAARGPMVNPATAAAVGTALGVEARAIEGGNPARSVVDDFDALVGGSDGSTVRNGEGQEPSAQSKPSQPSARSRSVIDDFDQLVNAPKGADNPMLPVFLNGLAQLETRGGKSTVKGPNGEDSFNLYNVKDLSGKGIRARDKAEGSNDAYRTYSSKDDATADVIGLLQRKYPDALKAKTPEEFAQALKRGGYATDPNYVAKLVAVIKSKAQQA